MSFGWSAGDIASAIKLLVIVGKAAKEAFSDSPKYSATIEFFESLKRTLQILQAFGNASSNIEVERLEDLREQCRRLRSPVIAFLEESKRFEPALATVNGRAKLMSAPRRVQWALVMPGKIKKLREDVTQPMLSINLLLGLQTLERVSCFHDSIPETIRTQISNVFREAFNLRLDEDIGRVKDLLQEQKEGPHQTSLDGRQQILQHIQNVERMISTTLKERAIEENRSAEMLHSTFNDIHLLVRRMAGDVKNKTVTQDLGEVSQNKRENLPRIFEQPASRLPATGLDNKNIQGQGGDFELALHDLKKNGLKCALTLVTILQLVIREVALFLIPYMIIIYQQLLQRQWRFPLLLTGDRFLFEDGLGRTSRLCCADFQCYEVERSPPVSRILADQKNSQNIYYFLKTSFKGVPGQTHVRTRSFEMMNGYNGCLIIPQTWQAFIQPKVKIAMAMLVEASDLQEGLCPSRGCIGKVNLTDVLSPGVCDICKMHIKIAQPFKGSDPASPDGDSGELAGIDERDSSKLPYQVQLNVNVLEQDRSAGASRLPTQCRLAVVEELTQRRETQRSDMPHFTRLAVTPGYIWRHVNLWSCCCCQIQGGMSVDATTQCPECNHPRCSSCLTETMRIEKLLRPGTRVRR